MTEIPALHQKSRRGFLKGSGALVVTAAVVPASALAGETVEEFIGRISNQVLTVVNSAATAGVKKQQFKEMLTAHADIPTIAVFSLGKYARRLNDRDRETYYGLVIDYISHIFALHADGFNGETVTIVGSNKRSDRETLVSSKVRFANGRSLPVAWRVLTAGGGYKVFDVSVNGIWLAIQQRSEFVSVIQRNNGNIKALLEFLGGRA
ncbi:MAG: ABC transporter substrate-binding protein [Hyphomicrobiales bacterium]